SHSLTWSGAGRDGASGVVLGRARILTHVASSHAAVRALTPSRPFPGPGPAILPRPAGQLGPCRRGHAHHDAEPTGIIEPWRAPGRARGSERRGRCGTATTSCFSAGRA